MTFYSDHEFYNGKDDSQEGTCVYEKYNNFMKKMVPCGGSWTSAVHPPDQFRHWCSALEAGGDCMHFEGDPF